MADRDLTRRVVLGGGVAAGTVASLPLRAEAPPRPPSSPTVSASGPDPANLVSVTLRVNGKPAEMRIEPRVSLLDALRDELMLTGTKKGCGLGQCGACTVHLDGRRVVSCLTLAARCEGHAITTIEGLAIGTDLHPVQAAFLRHDAFQCGYCTPGQIMAAAALLQEGHAGDSATIREWMSGNICRCGAYPHIVDAIRDVAEADAAQAGEA